MSASSGGTGEGVGSWTHPPAVRAAALVFLLLLWAQLTFVLAPSWIGAAYYDYGWLIPPFVGS